MDVAWPPRRVSLEVSPHITHATREKLRRDATRRRRLTMAGWRSVEAVDADLISRPAFEPTIQVLRALLGR